MLLLDYQPKLIPILVLHHLREFQNIFFSVKNIQDALNSRLFAGRVERRAIYFVLKNSIEIGLPIEAETRQHNEKFYRWVEDQCTANALMQDSAPLEVSAGSPVRRHQDWKKAFPKSLQLLQ